MITVTVEKRYGAATVRARVAVPTIERAVEMAGENSRVEFPIEGETFFAPVSKEGVDYEGMDTHTLEFAVDAGLPGAYEAYLWRLMEVLDVEEDLASEAAPAFDTMPFGDLRAAADAGLPGAAHAYKARLIPRAADASAASDPADDPDGCFDCLAPTAQMRFGRHRVCVPCGEARERALEDPAVTTEVRRRMAADRATVGAA